MSEHNSPLRNELFVCACESMEHQIAFTCDDNWETVIATIHLVPEYNIFKRIWKAIKYIFGYRCKYGHFEEFIFNPENADHLQQVVDYIKSKKIKCV
jgi:hypothetical protein